MPAYSFSRVRKTLIRAPAWPVPTPYRNKLIVNPAAQSFQLPALRLAFQPPLF
jgi:hypothetical protein